MKLNVASYAFKVLREKHILELVKEEKDQGATIKQGHVPRDRGRHRQRCRLG